MGQQSSSQLIQSGNQSHQRLGIVRVFQASDLFNQNENPYRIQIKRNIESEDRFEKWVKKLREIDSDEARDILYLPLTFKFEKTSICGSSGHLTLTFEHFPYVLKTQVRNRRKMSQFFEQTELWYLLYNLVEAGTIFQKKGKKLGDVHPNNCLLNQNGQFKLICLCSLPDQTTNYDKIMQSPTTDTFLAPQQIDPTFIQKGIYPAVDSCKAQVFSMGMTLLEAATLEDCFYTYNRGPYKVNKKRLADLLKLVKEKYRKPFYDYLSNMLEEQPKRRKKCSQIFYELHQYEEAILELKQFHFNGQQTSMLDKSVDRQGFADQSTIQMQRPPTYNTVPNNYMGNTISQPYGMSPSSTHTMNYVQPQTKNSIPYGTVSYSNTSLDKGIRR